MSVDLLYPERMLLCKSENNNNNIRKHKLQNDFLTWTSWRYQLCLCGKSNIWVCRFLIYLWNKYLEPRVSPAFAITYFCNHCNITFENTSKYVDTLTFSKKLEPKVIDPKMIFDPKSVEVTCVILPEDHCVRVPRKYIKVCWYSDPFFQNLNQRSLTPRWFLTPCLLRSHVWLCPRVIVSKSHGNTSMYVDTVINFAKLPHTTYYVLHTTYRMSDHIVSYWTQFRQDRKDRHAINGIVFCAFIPVPLT